MAMKEVYKHCALPPKQKMQKAKDGITKILEQQEMQQWGISVEQELSVCDAKILLQPTMKDGLQCSEDNMRRLALEEAFEFAGTNWTICYQSSTCFNAAESFV